MEKDKMETTTKEDILKACAHLFYEKGYRRTSFQDICQEAHVYRGTIYYYYKEKSVLRREVLQAHYKSCLALAEKHCGDSDCVPFLAHYIQWYKFLNDAKMRRFIVEYFSDEPVYQEKKGLSQFYRETFRETYLPLVRSNEIPVLSFASVYGYIAGMVRLADSDPSAYPADTFFFECLTTILKIWDLEKDREKVCRALRLCIQNFPVHEINLDVLI